MTSVSGEGWSRPGHLHKHHFFREQKSLCGRHRLVGVRPQFSSDVSERRKCVECKALLAEARELEVSV